MPWYSKYTNISYDLKTPRYFIFHRLEAEWFDSIASSSGQLGRSCRLVKRQVLLARNISRTEEGKHCVPHRPKEYYSVQLPCISLEVQSGPTSYSWPGNQMANLIPWYSLVPSAEISFFFICIFHFWFLNIFCFNWGNYSRVCPTFDCSSSPPRRSRVGNFLTNFYPSELSDVEN